MSWQDPTTLLDFTTSEVVNATKLDRIRDDLLELKSAVDSAASTTTVVNHLHKTGTLANLPTFTSAEIGREYYATDLGVFFFNDGGRWIMKDGNYRAGDFYKDDFFGNPAVPGPGSTWQDLSSGGGGWLWDTFTVTGNPSARRILVTNASVGGRGGMALPNNVMRIWDITRVPAMFEFRVAVKSVSRLNERMYIGLVQGIPTVNTEPSGGIYFRKIDTGTESFWQGVCNDTGVITPSSNFATQDANFHNFTARINAGGASVDFFVDDVSIGNVSANIPDAMETSCIGCWIDTNTTQSKILHADHFVYAAGAKPTT